MDWRRFAALWPERVGLPFPTITRPDLVDAEIAALLGLDLSAIETAIQRKDPRGERPYNPAMMVALLVYAYCTGV